MGESCFPPLQEIEAALWLTTTFPDEKMKQGLPLTFPSLFWYALLVITSIYFVSIVIGVNDGGCPSSLAGCAETDFS